MSVTEKLKIVVFSDSHGISRPMLKATDLHKNNSDYFIFLGDGLADSERIRDITDKPLITVPGNSDGFLSFPPCSKDPVTCTIDFGNIILFICHGHTLGVKSGLVNLVSMAIKNNADIALFGHTHKPHDEYISAEKTGGKPLYLFNPRSISLQRGGAPSYGIIESNVQNGKRNILLSHAVLK